MRTCPLHKTLLVFEEGSKYRLICTQRVSKDGKSWDCPHVEYTSSANPSLTDSQKNNTYVPSWR